MSSRSGRSRLRSWWERALNAPRWNGPPVWAHGDLDARNWLVREGRMELAQSCFEFLPTRIALDLMGWDEMDIFAHS